MMMRTCETSGCENAAKNGGLCAECLRREYPMLEEMTMKALRLAERAPLSVVRQGDSVVVTADGHSAKEVTDALLFFDRRFENIVSCDPNGDVRILQAGYNFRFVGQR